MKTTTQSRATQLRGKTLRNCYTITSSAASTAGSCSPSATCVWGGLGLGFRGTHFWGFGFQVSGFWFLVSGIRFLASGLWFVVCGVWFLASNVGLDLAEQRRDVDALQP